MLEDLWFRVEGLGGSRVWGLGLRVWGLGLRVCGSGSWVWGLGLSSSHNFLRISRDLHLAEARLSARG